VSDEKMIARARRIHTPSGEGGSGGRLRFMSFSGTVIVDGEKTSPPGVVCMCVFIVFYSGSSENVSR